MDNKQKRTWVNIHLDNLEHNVGEIRRHLPEDCRVLGVVKANAYGHGAVEVARRLERAGCGDLAVACFDEALSLREAGIRCNILILGYTDPAYAPVLAERDITQAIGSLEMAEGFSKALQGRRLRAHMKLETGMGRTGFRTEDPKEMEEALVSLKLEGLDFEGVFTHFAVSDELGEPFTQTQFTRFTEALGQLERAWGKAFAIHHCANSGAVINYPCYAMDMVRAGLITYGLYPAGETGGMALRPVMELKTRVTQITSHAPGDTISYGRAFTADRPMRLAVLSIGYADGLFRCLSDKLEVLIRGKRMKQVGRICMDMCMVDVTEHPEIITGDEATIFGFEGEASISVDELAEKAGTISYELLCAISPRVPHVFLG